MTEKSNSDASDAAGRSPLEHRSQANLSAPLPPSQLSQSAGGPKGTGLGITGAHSMGPGFVTENLGKLMGAFFILLFLGILAYAFAPDSWLGI